MQGLVPALQVSLASRTSQQVEIGEVENPLRRPLSAIVGVRAHCKPRCLSGTFPVVGKLGIAAELFTFLRVRKKWWLFPVVLLLLLLAVLVVFSESSAVAPFIYTLF